MRCRNPEAESLIAPRGVCKHPGRVVGEYEIRAPLAIESRNESGGARERAFAVHQHTVGVEQQDMMACEQFVDGNGLRRCRRTHGAPVLVVCQGDGAQHGERAASAN